MTRVISIEGVEIIQKNFQQILIRGDGKEKFNQKKTLNLQRLIF